MQGVCTPTFRGSETDISTFVESGKVQTDIPVFGLLVTSPLGLKATRVGSFIRIGRGVHITPLVQHLS